MSEPHHDPISDNIETHPVKLAAGVAVGAIALVVAIVLLAQFAVGAYGSRSIKDDASMKPEAVARRIAPVAMLAMDPNAPPPAAAAPTTAVAAVVAPAAKASGADAGKKTYEAACTACHASGVAGAPKLGDKPAWAARVKTGKEALYASALKGKGAMPPKGGNTALADADVKAAVDYLLASLK